LYYDGEDPKVRFPSTEDTAQNMRFILEEIRKTFKDKNLDTIKEKIKEKVDLLKLFGDKWYEEYISRLYEGYTEKDAFIKIPLYLEREIKQKKQQNQKEEKKETWVIVFETFYALYYLMNYYYEREDEKQYKKLKKAFEQFLGFLKEEAGEKLVKKIKKTLSKKYYSIILADGDNIGELMKGNLYEALIDTKLKNKNDISDDTINNRIKFYVELIESVLSHTLPNYESMLNKVKTLFNIVSKNNTLREYLLEEYYEDEGLDLTKKEKLLFPLSISYQVAISRSLMISSLTEVKEVEKIGGFIVYAGGDDLMAICPKELTVDIIRRTREIFSGKENMFRKFRSINRNQCYLMLLKPD
jgi:CRISPR-associated protein Cas10/Cmr2 subtype III-B